MAASPFYRALAIFQGIRFRNANATTTLKGIKTGTVSLNPGSIATVSRGTVTFTLTGAAVGDSVTMRPPAALDDDLIFCGEDVTADNTVTVYLYNPTGGAIDDSARTWGYTWLDLT